MKLSISFRRTARRSAPLAMAALLGLGAAACSREAPKAERLRPVLTEIVGAAAANDGAVYAGEVRSRVEQLLGFRIAGKISARLVDAGSPVKPGQVLARLDPVDTALNAGAAEAQRQLAEAEARRYRELKARNFVSQAALDTRETSLKAAAAQADIASNQSAYTVLKADQPGVIGQVLAEVGQVVTAGQPVYRLARQDTLEVAIAIPENRLQAVRSAGTADIVLWADDSVHYHGKLREIAAMADPQTRTYAARVTIDNIDPRVIFGMSATVRFAGTAAREALAIPLTALFQKDEKPAVWVVGPDDTIQLRRIVIARYTDDAVEVTSGLKRGERIVTAGVHKLNEGEKIHIAERSGNAAGEFRMTAR